MYICRHSVGLYYIPACIDGSYICINPHSLSIVESLALLWYILERVYVSQGHSMLGCEVEQYKLNRIIKLVLIALPWPDLCGISF